MKCQSFVVTHAIGARQAGRRATYTGHRTPFPLLSGPTDSTLQSPLLPSPPLDVDYEYKRKDGTPIADSCFDPCELGPEGQPKPAPRRLVIDDFETDDEYLRGSTRDGVCILLLQL